jgi:tetratricopeptide (TPR) repeat protein
MRHWYVVAASTMAARGAGATASRYVERAVDEFPTDKAVRFWQGYVEERRHRLQASERAYWRAVEYDPGYLEARLRLGFVLHEEGDYEQSRRQLELVRDAGGTALVRYLTHLFLGKSKEAANDFQGAAREYEAAIWVGPFCQSAHVALSYAEERAGNHLKAQRLAARFAALPKDACAADPWWFHQFRSLDDEALTWLHDNVR